jgi:uncharacterized membrane protein
MTAFGARRTLAPLDLAVISVATAGAAGLAARIGPLEGLSSHKGRRRKSMDGLKTELRETEERLLSELRAVRSGMRTREMGHKSMMSLTVGQRIADQVAATMGSWKFIIIQTTILFFWIVLNVTAYVQRWDPYPFILLNLALSFQAAYAAPFIMMSQNRQQDIDRKEAENDYQINIKAELEIELLHQKIDALREKEVLTLSKAIADLTELLRKGNGGPSTSAS